MITHQEQRASDGDETKGGAQDKAQMMEGHSIIPQRDLGDCGQARSSACIFANPDPLPHFCHLQETCYTRSTLPWINGVPGMDTSSWTMRRGCEKRREAQLGAGELCMFVIFTPSAPVKISCWDGTAMGRRGTLAIYSDRPRGNLRLPC
jgi:hypothetical protein